MNGYATMQILHLAATSEETAELEKALTAHFKEERYPISIVSLDQHLCQNVGRGREFPWGGSPDVLYCVWRPRAHPSTSRGRKAVERGAIDGLEVSSHHHES